MKNENPRKELRIYDHKRLIAPEIPEDIVLIIKPWNVIDFSCFPYSFRFILITWIFILLTDMLSFPDLFLLDSLNYQAHSPLDWYIAGFFEAGVQFMLRGVHSESI